LVDKGIVYTLRRNTRITGETIAVQGNYYSYSMLCKVNVARVANIQSQDDLKPYLNQSGFDSTIDWLEEASPTARTLYKVTYIPLG